MSQQQQQTQQQQTQWKPLDEAPTLWDPQAVRRALQGGHKNTSAESEEVGDFPNFEDVDESKAKEEVAAPPTPSEAAGKQPGAHADFVANLAAPEGTKLFFPKVRSASHWQAIYSDYEKKFGRHINRAGTGYMSEKQVAYINFYKREWMLKGLELRQWGPREAAQLPEPASGGSLSASTSGDAPSGPPHFPAFAVGFENWKISEIKPIALKLLGASTIQLRESPEQPGLALGWAIVGFPSKEALEQALMKKKFVLQCTNKIRVIAVQPYREAKSTHYRSSSDRSGAERVPTFAGGETRARGTSFSGTSIPAHSSTPLSNRRSTPSTSTSSATPLPSGLIAQQRGWLERRATIRRWLAEGIIPSPTAERYLADIVTEEVEKRRQSQPQLSGSERLQRRPQSMMPRSDDKK